MPNERQILQSLEALEILLKPAYGHQSPRDPRDTLHAVELLLEARAVQIHREANAAWRKLAWVNTMLLWLTIIVGCSLSLFGCFSSARPGRSLEAEYSSAVAIKKTCIDTQTGRLSGSYGSGVIVTDHMILTAAHVVNPHGMFCTFEGLDATGSTFTLHPAVVDYTADIAQMVTTKYKFRYRPVSIGPVPELGAHVCVVTGFPNNYRRCGNIQPLGKVDPNLEIDMIVEHGNSGSGIYDDHGRLVGIAVALINCGNGQICESAGTSLWNRNHILPPSLQTTQAD